MRADPPGSPGRIAEGSGLSAGEAASDGPYRPGDDALDLPARRVALSPLEKEGGHDQLVRHADLGGVSAELRSAAHSRQVRLRADGELRGAQVDLSAARMATSSLSRPGA